MKLYAALLVTAFLSFSLGCLAKPSMELTDGVILATPCIFESEPL
jgi:hypothetical protein